MSVRGRRALVVGAGGLGTVYGAALARGGADVQLLARRAHAEAIQRAGAVEVHRPQDRDRVALRAEWRPERIEPVDTVILTTKSHDTPAALAGLRHLAAGVRDALSFQNGIEKDRRLADWCGADAVVGAMSMEGGSLMAPGVVAHTLLGASYLGELPGGSSERVDSLAADLRAGGLEVVVSERIRAVEWSKLAHAAPSMTMTVLPRLPFHRALRDPDLAALYVRLLREGAEIAAGDPAGVPFEDLPGMFPVRWMVQEADDAAAVAAVRERGRRMQAAGSTDVIVSMLADLRAGRRLELDAVHGFLVAEADRLGLEVPYNRACLDLLRAIDPHTSGTSR